MKLEELLTLAASQLEVVSTLNFISWVIHNSHEADRSTNRVFLSWSLMADPRSVLAPDATLALTVRLDK